MTLGILKNYDAYETSIPSLPTEHRDFFSFKNNITGKQESLKTRDKTAALRNI